MRLLAAIGLMSLFIVTFDASTNGRYGGMRPGTISDVPTTVREDEAAIRFAKFTADRWDTEDHKVCAQVVDLKVQTPDKVNWGHLGALQVEGLGYTRCMVRRSNVHLLYMLRQNCVGLNASVCKLGDKHVDP